MRAPIGVAGRQASAEKSIASWAPPARERPRPKIKIFNKKEKPNKSL